jgi:hypothetical protein
MTSEPPSHHTTLSITHHTRKRPSTGARTTHVLISPLDECIDNTHILVTKEKRKRKERTKRNSNKRSKAKGKAKSKITWRRQVSDPLGKGNGSTHPRQNHTQAKSTNHQSKARKPQRAPLHTCMLPLNQFNSTWTNACKPHRKIEKLLQPCSDRSDWSTSPVIPVG